MYRLNAAQKCIRCYSDVRRYQWLCPRCKEKLGVVSDDWDKLPRDLAERTRVFCVASQTPVIEIDDEPDPDSDDGTPCDICGTFTPFPERFCPKCGTSVEHDPSWYGDDYWDEDEALDGGRLPSQRDDPVGAAYRYLYEDMDMGEWEDNL